MVIQASLGSQCIYNLNYLKAGLVYLPAGVAGGLGAKCAGQSLDWYCAMLVVALSPSPLNIPQTQKLIVPASKRPSYVQEALWLVSNRRGHLGLSRWSCSARISIHSTHRDGRWDCQVWGGADDEDSNQRTTLTIVCMSELTSEAHIRYAHLTVHHQFCDIKHLRSKLRVIRCDHLQQELTRLQISNTLLTDLNVSQAATVRGSSNFVRCLLAGAFIAALEPIA